LPTLFLAGFFFFFATIMTSLSEEKKLHRQGDYQNAGVRTIAARAKNAIALKILPADCPAR
jgi:hypothetical protein